MDQHCSTWPELFLAVALLLSFFCFVTPFFVRTHTLCIRRSHSHSLTCCAWTYLVGFLWFFMSFCIVSGKQLSSGSFLSGQKQNSYKKDKQMHSISQKEEGQKKRDSWKFHFLRPNELLVKQLACRFRNAISPLRRWNMTGNCVAAVRQATNLLSVHRCFIWCKTVSLCRALIYTIVLQHPLSGICGRELMKNGTHTKKPTKWLHWFNSFHQQQRA